MIAFGVFCIIMAFASLYGAQYNQLSLIAVLVWAGLGSIMLARGLGKRKQANIRRDDPENADQKQQTSSRTEIDRKQAEREVRIKEKEQEYIAAGYKEYIAGSLARNAVESEERYEKEGYPWMVYLEVDDKDTQKDLFDLKLRYEGRGWKADAQYSGENGNYILTVDGKTVGRFSQQDGLWVESNFESLGDITGLEILGGDTDKDGKLRPFTPKVTIKLKPGIKPPEERRNPLPLSKIYRNGLGGDSVVLVSRTGKIHKSSTPCGVSAERCTPMLYEKAIADGYEECWNCFR